MKPMLVAAVLAALALAACSKESPPASPRVAAQPIEAAPQPATAPAPIPGAAVVPGAAVAHNTPPPVFADGRAKVGPGNCKACHPAQHASWTSSPHAAKGLDCEGCHGGGADYVKVMKDRKASYQAGLVMPKRALCRACHKELWHDAMYFKAHAHVHEVK